MKYYFIFKEAVDDFELHVFYKPMCHLLKSSYDVYMSIISLNRVTYSPLFTPHLWGAWV